MAEFKWARQRLQFETHGRDVVLCESVEQAAAAARAIADAFDVDVIDCVDDVRGTLRDRFGKRGQHLVPSVLAALRLDDDALEWRLKEVSPLRRLLSDIVRSLVNDDQVLVIELASFAAMPFDLAHCYRAIESVHAAFGKPIVVVIVDPALITSSGNHLTVLTATGIVEVGPASAALADPQSPELLARLEATPVPNPLAMQQRRVQRATTRPVNYAHTQITQRPTADAIALAGGELTN